MLASVLHSNMQTEAAPACPSASQTARFDEMRKMHAQPGRARLHTSESGLLACPAAAGHLSLLHVPTRTFIAGDAVTFLRPTLALANATRDADDTRVGGHGRMGVWPV